ncbi:MAG: UDP-2,4-diacetamido-2,4,6-trideoxy-beta-L-altropyranose hydrolase [Aliiglaciecola sp.]|uniref:UDP-2,4-diacetamido-2,4, 6-trideoxy-beta-L-altropyranose hydrolase n=1 Tax=Aliiglaciecola sp. TaxID=1872441 RepID=UPI003299C672
MPHILFRVNAGASSGLGHLMRCLALAQAMVKNQFTPIFMLNDEGANIARSRQDWVGEVIVVSESQAGTQEIEKIAEYSRCHPVAAIVLDGYDFSSLYRQQLAQLGYPVICFDDMNNSGHLHANLIINGSGSAHQLKYEDNQPHAQLCIGEAYRVLRQEFCELTELPFAQRQYLTIMMGGSDPANLTLPLLQCLQNKGFSGKLKVITGAAYPFLDELNKFIRTSKLDIQHLHDCQQIAQSFLQTRLAISAAGGSQFELQATATPSCLLTVADNQVGATQVAVKQAWCITEDFSVIAKGNENSKMDENQKRTDVEDTIKSVLRLWGDDAALLKMHNQGLKSRDTNGAQRIIEKIQQLCSDEE